MCGRYGLEAEYEQLRLEFDAYNRYIGYEGRKEIFPSEKAAVIIQENNQNYIHAAKWGFSNPFDNRPLINARSETVHEKKTFKDLLLHGRCIIPATHFFEWKKTPSHKKKYTVTVSSSPIFGMAGLYQITLDEKGEMCLRCIIITTAANLSMTAVHERMPAILSKETEKIWLDPSTLERDRLRQCLRPYDGVLNFIEEGAFCG